MRRYYCGICGSGRLAPEQAGRDDVRVWCLPCSEKTGKLVRRFRCGTPAEAKKAAELQAANIKRRQEERARRHAAAVAADVQKAFGSPSVPTKKGAKPVSCGNFSGVAMVYCSKPAGHAGDHYGHGYRWS